MPEIERSFGYHVIILEFILIEIWLEFVSPSKRFICDNCRTHNLSTQIDEFCTSSQFEGQVPLNIQGHLLKFGILTPKKHT